MLYLVEDLESARHFLRDTEECNITLTNPPGSVAYYGMRVLDYMFKALRKEFGPKISGVLVDTSGDYAAFVTAKQLRYKQIIFIVADNLRL